MESQMVVWLPALRANRPLPPGRFLELIPVRGWVYSRAIVRLEEFGQMKNTMTSSVIEPAPFQQNASIYIYIYIYRYHYSSLKHPNISWKSD
jgi:hypothetical protein